MPSASQVLLSEHARIRFDLHASVAALQALEVGGPGTLALHFPALGTWIGGLAAHAAKEDQVLFPAIERFMGSTQGPTHVMRQEHKEIDRQARHFIETLNGLRDRPIRVETEAPAGRVTEQTASGRGFTADVADSLHELAGLLDMHFEKEEQVLFPIAESLLPRAEQEELGEQLAAFRGEI